MPPRAQAHRSPIQITRHVSPWTECPQRGHSFRGPYISLALPDAVAGATGGIDQGKAPQQAAGRQVVGALRIFVIANGSGNDYGAPSPVVPPPPRRGVHPMGDTMKKRMVSVLIAGGLLAAMLPGVAAAAPDATGSVHPMSAPGATVTSAAGSAR